MMEIDADLSVQYHDFQMGLNCLPPEILREITRYLAPDDLDSLELASKYLREIVDDPYVWKVLCARDLGVEEAGLLVDDSANCRNMHQYIWSLPSKLDKKRQLGTGLSILDDGLSVNFSGCVGSDQVVFANRPYIIEFGQMTRVITKHDEGDKNVVRRKLYCSSIAYFEVTIGKEARGTRASRWNTPCVAVGLAHRNFPETGKQPGWVRNSFGYHSDDGNAFTCGRPFKYGPIYGPGNTVGCGWDLEKKIIFYTLDGINLGIAFKDVPDTELFPVIGVDSDNQITTNFGATPFKYNIEAHTNDSTSKAISAQGLMKNPFGGLFADEGIDGDDEDDEGDDEDDDDDDDDDMGDEAQMTINAFLQRMRHYLASADQGDSDDDEDDDDDDGDDGDDGNVNLT